MTIHCPTCGHELVATRIPVDALVAAPWSQIQRRIIERLAKAYPQDVDIGAMIDAVYWDRADGGPLDAEGVIRQIICRLRKSLTVYGWTIPASPSGRGHHGLYGLAPVEQR